jgi:hypothetical protein
MEYRNAILRLAIQSPLIKKHISRIAGVYIRSDIDSTCTWTFVKYSYCDGLGEPWRSNQDDITTRSQGSFRSEKEVAFRGARVSVAQICGAPNVKTNVDWF